MTTFNSLLVATDFSDDGNHAVRRAALLAHEHGARLHILHVLKPAGCRPLRDWFSRNKDIELKAAQALGALQRVSVEIQGAYGVNASVEVVVGDPFETLMKASERADLVVLGRRGRSRLEELLGGGAADRVLRTCRRAVLVVSLPVEKPYGRILVPIDFTAACDAALAAAGLLRGRGRGESTMHVFHAIDTQREAVLRDADVPEHIIRETRMMEEAGTNARMRRRAARLGLYDASIRFALAYGPPVRSTLMHAERWGADLIVVGKQGRSTVAGFLLGSVSRRVFSGADCDVLVVPMPGDGPSRVPQPAAPKHPHGWLSSADAAPRVRL